MDNVSSDATFADDLLSLSAGAKLVPSKPAPSTLWRWSKRGVFGVKLQVLCSGGRIFVRRSELVRFCDAVTQSRLNASIRVYPGTKAAEVDRQLESAGLTGTKRRGRPRKATATASAE
jgi:hypothetical protein